MLLALQIALIVLTPIAVARVIRLLTTDKITEQLVIRHVRVRARFSPTTDGRRGEPTNLTGYVIEALDCPFCCGFWVSLVMVTLAVITILWGAVWLLVTLVIIYGVLAVNYLSAHTSHRIDR